MLPCRWLMDLTSVSVLAVTLASLPMATRAEEPATCVATSTEQIAALSERWNVALAHGDPKALAGLYADDAVLLPMLSGEPLVGRQAIKSYFNEYIRRHPQGQINMRSIMVGCNVASDIGTYTYRLTGQRKGTRVAIGGRYSTGYEFRDGRWVIAHQHASAMTNLPQRAKLAKK